MASPTAARSERHFPALNEQGEIRYVQTRYLNPGTGPKYDNPSAALATNPRIAWTTAVGRRETSTLIVCEGIPDALTAAQAGFAAVAVLGSQVPDIVVAAATQGYASDRSLGVLLIGDNDSSGRTWTKEMRTLLSDARVPVHAFEPPEPGSDLNSWSLLQPGWSDALPHVPDLAGADIGPSRNGLLPTLR